MKLLNKLNSLYKREIESKPKKRFHLVFGLFLINLLLFGYFGVFVGLKSLVKKADLKKEYKVAISNMKDNTDKVDLLGSFLETDVKVVFVNKAIADDKDIQNYLESFVEASSKKGFIVKKFNVDNTRSDNSISISAVLEGNTAKTSDLLFAIEHLDRLTTVTDTKVVISKTDTPLLSEVVINLRIFTL